MAGQWLPFMLNDMYKIRRPRRQGVRLTTMSRPKTTTQKQRLTKPLRTEVVNSSSALKMYSYLSAHARDIDKRKEEEAKDTYKARIERREALRDMQSHADGERWFELQQEINILTVQIYNFENR